MYSKVEYDEMELKLLKTLKWKLFIKVPFDFVNILAFSINLDLNEKIENQIELFLDLCLLSKNLMLYLIYDHNF